LLVKIGDILASTNEVAEKSKHLAESIRSFGQYRWVGVYAVGTEFVSIIAWSGPGAPAHPQFPITRGLTGSAIKERTTIIVGDVRQDPRYLTAFGSKLSKIIVPVLRPGDGRVIGTIDIESERANAFTDGDRQVLAQCAQAAAPIWDS
jgi:GAF domain-containing protein